MYFSWDYKLNDFLFHNFNIDNISICLVVLAIVFLSAMGLELLKYLETIIDQKFELKLNEAINNTSQRQSVNFQESNSLVQSLRIPVSLKHIIYKKKLLKHLLFTLNRMITMTLAYLLMLVAMEYYYGHLFAIILGFTFGGYFFDTSVDRYTNLIYKNARTKESGSDRLASDAPTTSANALKYGAI